VELLRIFPPAEAAPKAVPQLAQPDTELHIRLALAEEKQWHDHLVKYLSKRLAYPLPIKSGAVLLTL
jgi:hypothetical protein